MSFSPNAEDVIPKVVSATETILEAAARQGGSIQRVVLTSSASAAALPQPGVEGIVVTEGRPLSDLVSRGYQPSLFRSHDHYLLLYYYKLVLTVPSRHVESSNSECCF